MLTNYVKNFGNDEFQKLYQKLVISSSSKEPIWRGTVFIGNKPLYIECHVKWIADKINSHFVNVLQNTYINGAKKLYVLNEGVTKFINMKLSEYSDVFFIGDNIFEKPDFIVNESFIFLRTKDCYFISVSDSNPQHVLYLDENHLFARLFYYIFDSSENIVLHSAAVAYNDYGILITGLSGSGKSTLAAHCLSKGMKFVGDDKIALHEENGILYANPIYSILSLKEPVKNIKTMNVFQQNDAHKDVFVLDKSQFSKNIKICAVVEPYNVSLNTPELLKTPLAPIITRICTDYSMFSMLTPNKNPLADYKKIFNLFCNIDSFKIRLSKSIPDNIQTLICLAKTGGTDVQ